jgi:hypothetical protein
MHETEQKKFPPSQRINDFYSHRLGKKNGIARHGHFGLWVHDETEQKILFPPSQNKSFIHTWEKKWHCVPRSFWTTLWVCETEQKFLFPPSQRINDFYSHRLGKKNGITRATVILDFGCMKPNKNFVSQVRINHLFTDLGKKTALRAMVILDFGCMKPNKKFFPSQNK